MSHHMLPGSYEQDGRTVTAGIHTGSSEWDIQNLRYIRAEVPENPDPKTTVIQWLGGIYDNSEGCLLKDDFRMKEPTS